MMSADFTWNTSPAAGARARALDTLWWDLERRRTSAFLLISHERIIHERYAPGAGRDIPHHTASLAKALVGGLSLMIARGDETPDCGRG